MTTNNYDLHSSTLLKSRRQMFCLFCLVLHALLPVCDNHCHGARTSYRVHFISKSLVEDNSVLLAHVFANFSVQNFSHCSSLCRKHCRCRSFNLPMTGKGDCQLNDADKSTAFLKPRKGWRYHHLQEVESYLGDVSTRWIVPKPLVYLIAINLSQGPYLDKWNICSRYIYAHPTISLGFLAPAI